MLPSSVSLTSILLQTIHLTSFCFLVVVSVVISINATDCLEKFFSNMICCVKRNIIPFSHHTVILRPGARRELLDFMVQGKINRGRHTDHTAGRHSIRTKQCPPPSSPCFLQAGCSSCCPTNSVKALKAYIYIYLAHNSS